MNRKNALKLIAASAIWIACKKNMPNVNINRKALGVGGTPYPVVAPIGTLFSQDYSTVSNLSGYTVTNPHSTWAISGGFLNSTASGATIKSDYIVYNTYGSTVLDQWSQTTDVYVRQVDANSIGLVLGCRNSHTLVSPGTNYFCFINCISGITGYLAIYDDNSNTLAFDFTGLAISVNDHLRITVSRNYGSISLTLLNVTTGLSRPTLSATVTAWANTTNLEQTVSKFSLGNRGGNYDFASQAASSTANKNVDYAFIGHSIPSGYNSGAYTNSWPNIAMGTVPSKTFTRLLSQSGCINAFLTCLNEYDLVNARCYVMPDMRNDLALGRTLGQAEADYQTLYNHFANMGKRIITPSSIPTNGLDLRPSNSFIQSNYPTSYVDIFNGGWLNAPYSLLSPYNGQTNDGTHPSQNMANDIGVQFAAGTVL